MQQQEYVRGIVRGILHIFDTKELPDDAKADLQDCLKLLVSQEDTPFEWNTSMYMHAQQVPGQVAPRLNLRDNAYDDVSERKEITESLVDMEDSRGKPRPTGFLANATCYS